MLISDETSLLSGLVICISYGEAITVDCIA